LVYNDSARQFFAAIRGRGSYSSSDGIKLDPPEHSARRTDFVPVSCNGGVTRLPDLRWRTCGCAGRNEMYAWHVVNIPRLNVAARSAAWVILLRNKQQP